MKTQKSHSCHSSGRRRGHHGRKERVLHTRISEQLSEEIRSFAENLRVPASNLVRNVLEEVFTVVDDVSGDVAGLFDDLIEEAEGVRERIRNQDESSHRRRHRGRGRRRRHASGAHHATGADADSDVEAELTRDEAAEGPNPTTAKSSTASKGADSTEPRADAAKLFPEILGWQPLVLNRDFECGRCQENLDAGESAFLGLGEKGLTQIALCGRCAGRR